MKPLMSGGEIASIKRALLRRVRPGRTLNILEWGSGGSTVFFSDFLEKNGIDFLWHSVEYNKRWQSQVCEAVSDRPSVIVHLFDVGNDVLRQRYIDMEEYIAFPGTLGIKFDFILVDGRKRRRCILEAKNLLAPNGTVFLHDAERRYYHCAFSHFPNQTFARVNLWRGDLKNVSLLARITNRIRSFFFISLYWSAVRPTQIVKGRAKAKLRLMKVSLSHAKGIRSKLNLLLYAFLLALKRLRLPIIDVSKKFILAPAMTEQAFSTASYANFADFAKEFVSLARGLETV